MPWIGSTSMFGMLRAAAAKPLCSSAPSMINALVRPRPEKCPVSVLVLASLIATLSTTIRPPSFAFAESAWRSASARTFFGRSWAWLRTTGPKARPPPRNCGTRAEPWRAPPVPFCLYIFLPVRQASARPCALWVPACRLASCQLTQRWIRSLRGTRPKISSESSTDPASLPSSVVIFNFISRTLLPGFRRIRRSSSLFAIAIGNLELAGLRRILRQRLLHRVANRDPAALGAGYGAFDQNQPALDVGLHHPEIERGDAVDAHVARHLLVLEGLARILASAGRTDRAMRDRDTVGGAQAAEIPALHAAGETLADRGAGDVDELADHEVIRLDFSTDRDQRVFGDAEFRELALRLDGGLGKLAALRLRQIYGLAASRAELQRGVTVLLAGAVTQHLAIAQLEHGHRDVLTGLGKDPCHPDLLCDHSGAHRRASCLSVRYSRTGSKNQSLISTSTPAARSSFISASTVCGVGSTMSRRRLWVRISNCSRLFLSTCGERLTVNFSMRVGSGMGPRTWAPVRFAVFTISRVDVSRIRWSNALRRMRIFWPFIAVVSFFVA